MTTLRAVEAGFAREGAFLVEPFSLTLAPGAQLRLPQPNVRAATIAARLCAAIVRPTTGTIYVGEYETRLQPPQAKRLVGFVDAAGCGGDEHTFDCEVAFRADVWGLDPARAHLRARTLLDALATGRSGDGNAYARAVALALVPPVALVVLDQPQPGIVARVRDLEPEAGILITCVGVADRSRGRAQLEPATT